MDANRRLNVDLIKILDLAVLMTDQDVISYISPFACDLLMTVIHSRNTGGA